MEEAGGWDSGQGNRRLSRDCEPPVLVRWQGLGWFQGLDLVTLRNKICEIQSSASKHF